MWGGVSVRRCNIIYDAARDGEFLMRAGPMHQLVARPWPSTNPLRSLTSPVRIKRSSQNRWAEGPTMDTQFPCTRKTIRPAMPADAKAIRMLIPELHEASVCFIAADDANRIIGVAGATRSCRSQPPIGPGIAMHIIEPCRRQGIGRRLLQCLEQAASGEGAEALYGESRVEQGSDAMYGWQWLGFKPCETVETQRLPLDQFEPRLAPLFGANAKHK